MKYISQKWYFVTLIRKCLQNVKNITSTFIAMVSLKMDLFEPSTTSATDGTELFGRKKVASAFRYGKIRL